MNNDRDEERQRAYAAYQRERYGLEDVRREQSRLFDRAILTLAAGAFALSLTFVNQVSNRVNPSTLCFLTLSWVFFSLSVASTLISFLVSQHAHTRQIDIVEAEYLTQLSLIGASRNLETQADSAVLGKAGGAVERNRWCEWTGWLNWISLGCFLTGMAFLTAFGGSNLSAYIPGGSDARQTQIRAEGGAKEAGQEGSPSAQEARVSTSKGTTKETPKEEGQQ